MSKIVIKRQVSFDILGDEYKEAYVTFRSIPAKDYEQINDDVVKLEADSKLPFNYLLGVLKKYFLEGKFPTDGKLEDLSAEDLDGIDGDTIVICFQRLTGQVSDPKVESPSTSQSSTEASTTK